MRNEFLLLTCLTTSMFAGCASSTNKALDQKIANEPAPAGRKDIAAKADEAIAKNQGLTDDQRKRLAILRSQVSSQLDEINVQSLKLRSVLVEELLSPTYSIDEVELIKGRLKKLENKRLSVMFDGVDQASSILGRQAPQNRRVMRELLENRGIQD